MQKTEYCARSLHPSTPGAIFRFAASLLVFAVVSVYAGEPVMPLGMNSLSEKYPASSFTQWASGSDSLYLFYRQSDLSETGRINAPETDLFLPAKHDETQTNAIQGDAFLLVRNNSRSIKPVTVAAGYRQIWDDKSTLQKICLDYQDPGYAYVSASFSF